MSHGGFNRNNFYGFYGNILQKNSTVDSEEETQGCNARAKTYINPQIFNYDYIKMSLGKNTLSASNKIHFNPNFKCSRNGTNCIGKCDSVSTMAVPGTSQTTPWRNGKFMNSFTSVNYNKKHFQSSLHKMSLKKEETQNSTYSWINCGNKSENKLNQPKTQKHKEAQTIEEFKNESHINKMETITCRNKSQFRLIVSNNKLNPCDSSNLICKKINKRIFLSKTKLVNFTPKEVFDKIDPPSGSKLILKPTKDETPIKRNQSVYFNNKFKKRNSAIRNVTLIENKCSYKNSNSHKITQYKIDKRQKLPQISCTKFAVIRTNDITKLFPNRYQRHKYVNPKIIFGYNRFIDSKNSLSWRRNHPGNPTGNKVNYCSNRRIVKIGGIFYKSTSSKLILANKNKQSTENSEQNGKFNLLRKKSVKNHIVYVRGEKFLLDKNGKTLIKESGCLGQNKNSLTFRRVDIGGVTYLQKSQNILIRTNVHQARQIVNHAKQKSIATLCQLRKRSALPCMIYHKFGKCAKHKKGLCMYKHDPKNIAVCKKYIKGNCDNNNCFLSHEVIQEKMATCHFFLNGCCNRSNCLFLHVKINKNADICENFLHGFCSLGENCNKRHLYQCPEYDKNKICTLGKKCPYPHKSKEYNKNVSAVDEESNNSIKYTKNKLPLKTKVRKQNDRRPILELRKCSSSETGKKEKIKRKAKLNLSSTSDQIALELECVPKKVKLDNLPAFIPLQLEN